MNMDANMITAHLDRRDELQARAMECAGFLDRKTYVNTDKGRELLSLAEINKMIDAEEAAAKDLMRR
jgi:hypothetical protein